MMHVRGFNRFRKAQRQFAKFVWLHCLEYLLSSSSCSIQRRLPQKKKQRQSKRYADDQCSNRRQPQKPHSQTSAFALNKPEQHDCRNYYIHRKKRADPIGEQFATEQRNIQTVLQQPRNKLRIRKKQNRAHNKPNRSVALSYVHDRMQRQNRSSKFTSVLISLGNGNPPASRRSECEGGQCRRD